MLDEKSEIYIHVYALGVADIVVTFKFTANQIIKFMRFVPSC